MIQVSEILGHHIYFNYRKIRVTNKDAFIKTINIRNIKKILCNVFQS